jgi:hypothetical protein
VWGDLAKPTYIRLERWGNRLILKYSVDAKEWLPRYQFPVQEVNLARKLKVGVAAHAMAGGTFKAVIDQFRLTPLGGKAR